MNFNVGVQGVVTKLRHCQLLLRPENDTQFASIGLKSTCHATAGDLKGYVKFECEFVIPKCKLKLQEENDDLINILEKLDLIKGLEEIDYNLTPFGLIHDLSKKLKDK